MSVTKSNSPVRKLFDVPIAATTLPQVLNLVHETILVGGQLRIGVVNAAKIVSMRRDPGFRDAVVSSHVILADGMSVVLASRLLGRPLPARVTGIDLMHGMLEAGNRHRYCLYCLGATDEVLAVTTARIGAQYPGVQIVGSHNGYFSPAEEAAVAADIAACRPDILLVAMTSPRKEQFMAKWSSQLGVPVCHGVGGSFDVMAGKLRRAPRLWQRLGLEWLYRLKQEPARLWKRYLVTNTLFCWMMVAELFRQSE